MGIVTGDSPELARKNQLTSEMIEACVLRYRGRIGIDQTSSPRTWLGYHGGQFRNPARYKAKLKPNFVVGGAFIARAVGINALLEQLRTQGTAG